MSVSLGAGELFTFGLLTLALAALWLPRRGTVGAWLAAALAATACALFFGFLDLRGVAALVVFAIACRWLHLESAPMPARLAASLVVVTLAGLFLLHLAPGFANPVAIDAVALKAGALPYTKHLNFDKAAAGLLLVAFGVRRIAAWRDWKRTFALTAPVAGATVAAVLVPSLALGFVRFDPKPAPASLFAVWVWTNLFFTCIAEEAVFRGLIQRGLEKGLARFSAGSTLALLAASLVFGLAHLAGGWFYAGLSTLAGLGYGYAMRRTGRLEAAILTHFAVNLIHFTVFSYPALS